MGESGGSGALGEAESLGLERGIRGENLQRELGARKGEESPVLGSSVRARRD